MISVVSTNDLGQFVQVFPPCTAPAYDGATWPASTDTLCWQCCHSFQTQPLPMPLAYDDRKDRFRVIGTFCSWNCMVAYNRDHNKLVLNRGPHALAISLFHKRMTGSTKTITPAPPRCVLKAFGGYMDIEEYRKSSETQVMCTLPAKCVIVSQIVHDRRTSEARRTMSCKISNLNDQVDLSHAKSSANPQKYGDTLKLRRPKKDTASSVVSKGSSMLEVTLGLASPS